MKSYTKSNNISITSISVQSSNQNNYTPITMKQRYHYIYTTDVNPIDNNITAPIKQSKILDMDSDCILYLK